MYGNLFLSANVLVDSFLLLWLKKYDAKLNEEDRRKRNIIEKVIFSSSLFGNGLSIYILASRVSFFTGMPFNPINDLKIFVGILGILYCSHSLGITCCWPSIE